MITINDIEILLAFAAAIPIMRWGLRLADELDRRADQIAKKSKEDMI